MNNADKSRLSAKEQEKQLLQDAQALTTALSLKMEQLVALQPQTHKPFYVKSVLRCVADAAKLSGTFYILRKMLA